MTWPHVAAASERSPGWCRGLSRGDTHPQARWPAPRRRCARRRLAGQRLAAAL